MTRLLHETTSLCGTCKNALPARVVASPEGEVWMNKTCPVHGEQAVRISTSAAWYERTRAVVPVETRPRRVMKEVTHGCPFDCGPCSTHTQKIRMPVVTITSQCDLACPICYVHNKNDGAFHMSREEFARVLEKLVEGAGGDLDLINLTGGEPTLHPHLLDLVRMCHEAGIHRVSVCSHGLGLAKDDALLRGLADLGARIALSFDTFQKDVDQELKGVRSVDAKLRCLERLDRAGVNTTLIPVMTRGRNDHEIGRIIDLGVRTSCVRHLEVHTVTYTGQGGASFDRSGRISMLEVLERIEQTTSGLLKVDDFVSSPCTHPLCYQIAYLLVDDQGGPPIPFTRFMPRETLYASLGDHLYLEPGPKLERAMQDAIDRLWSEGGDERTLRLLSKLTRELFPIKPLPRDEALRVSERAVKAVYVHSHMDEETFDTERAAQCCDSNVYADGTSIPVCNYNVLYREKEPRFMTAPRAWNERSGGMRALPVVS
jgi:7,8-dihydro-6-hydroxymethylpterin dimethyltransferase